MSTVTKEITEYPFIASEERATAIRNNYKHVVVGMTSIDVQRILDDPDEIRPLFEPVAIEGKLIGYTYWYVIRRLTPSGSVDEKKEALVRISFSLEDRVTRIDNWGLVDNNP